MQYKEIISRTDYNGFVVVSGIMDGSDFGMQDYPHQHAETYDGAYIGNVETARHLVHNRGIAPELRETTDSVCSVGFCQSEQKWYGWSHRAMFGFGIGSKVSKGDCGYVASTPEELIEEIALVDYVYSRPKGNPIQEAGGVMLCLAALCNSELISMQDAAFLELERVDKPHMVKKIRKKWADKPEGPLPQ